MKNEYFESDEFKEILEKYEASEQQGTTCYFDAEDFVDIADHYLLSERPDEALSCINMGLVIHPNDEELLSTKSGAYIFMHMFEEAREIVSELSDNDTNVIYQRAQLKYAIDNDIQAAEEIFSDWLESEEEASKFDTEEERNDRIRDAYLHIITSFVELRGPEYDDELVKRWIEEYYARFSPLGSSEFDLILADMVRNEGFTDMTEKIYTSLLEYDPYINYGWIVLGAAQVMNGHFKEALESAEFALAIEPDNSDAILNKAHAYYSMNEREKALPYFERFLSKIDDGNQYLPYALCLATCNRADEAIIYCEKANEHVLIHRDQTDYYVQANYELAEAYMACNEGEKALESIERSLEIYPDDVDFLLLHATILLSSDEIQKCIDSFIKAVQCAKDKIWVTCSISLRFIFYKQYDTSLQIIDTCETYGTDNPSYRMVSGYRALVYMHKGDVDNFMSNLQQACQECPDVLQNLFNGVFPDTVEPKDYYEYLLNNPF